MEYAEIHHTGSRGWWRPLVGLGLVGVLMLVGQAVVMVALMAVLLVAGVELDEIEARLNGLAEGHLTVTGLVLATLGLWCLIPATWLAQYAVHRLPPGTLASVVGRIRWGWLVTCLGLAVVAVALTFGVAALLPDTTDAALAGDGGMNPVTDTAVAFLVAIVVLVPLQAVGEEYAFRGYLLQAAGGVFGDRAVARAFGVGFSALVFALMHGSQELPIFFDRFAFGVVAGILVLLTGGLEAAIALHVVNNLVAFGTAVLFGDIASAMTPSDSTWWQVPVSMVQVGSFLLMAWFVARRRGIATTVPDPVPWARPRALVPPGPYGRPGMPVPHGGHQPMPPVYRDQGMLPGYGPGEPYGQVPPPDQRPQGPGQQG